MCFQELLDCYMQRLDCSGRELAEASGLSAAIISRYRSGSRLPSSRSDSLDRLADGLAKIAEKRGEALTAAEIQSALEKSLEREKQPALNAENLAALMAALEISPAELALALSYDISYISRVRSGQRNPADAAAFAEGVGSFVEQRYTRKADRQQLAGLLGCPEEQLREDGLLRQALRDWLLQEKVPEQPQATAFLEKLDAFDLEEYIEAIHFRDIKLPSFPVPFPSARTYYGVEQMKAGELDFFKMTVLSRQGDSVLMCSDMPMEDMGQDQTFAKKWMFGLAAMLKKGLHLNIIHNLNRPFAEMMLGLEGWIPLYMTGQVTPYYLPGVHNQIFCRLLYVSGAAALAGECISGCHESGKYYLTKKQEELKYYRKRFKDLLRQAQPLMEIFRAEDRGQFEAFLKGDGQAQGSRHGILSVPPIYTMEESLLKEILTRNGVAKAKQEELYSEVIQRRSMVEQILTGSTIFDELHAMSREEFHRRRVSLSTAEIFYEMPLTYTYEEYLAHIRQTEEFARQHANYSVNLNMAPAFHNIAISILENRWAMVSKEGDPVIHFVIRHPQLREAIERMTLPVSDE